MTRECCVCRMEPSDGAPVRFPLLRVAYPLGVQCRASWRIEAKSLKDVINNPAKVQVAFRRWMAAREKVAA